MLNDIIFGGLAASAVYVLYDLYKNTISKYLARSKDEDDISSLESELMLENDEELLNPKVRKAYKKALQKTGQEDLLSWTVFKGLPIAAGAAGGLYLTHYLASYIKKMRLKKEIEAQKKEIDRLLDTMFEIADVKYQQKTAADGIISNVVSIFDNLTTSILRGIGGKYSPTASELRASIALSLTPFAFLAAYRSSKQVSRQEKESLEDIYKKVTELHVFDVDEAAKIPYFIKKKKKGLLGKPLSEKTSEELIQEQVQHLTSANKTGVKLQDLFKL